MSEPPAPPRRRPDPSLGVVAVVVIGLIVATLHHAQLGLWIVCGALGGATVMRLLLRERDAGLLVVRARKIDVVVLASLAIGLGVLAAVTPFPSGKG